MIIGAEGMLARLDITRQLAITGEPRTGKDLLAREIAMYYLDRGYKFYTNSMDIWNDPLYIRTNLWDYFERNGGYRGSFEGQDKELMIKTFQGFEGSYPDVKRRVFILTEAGMYLREWKYFNNINAFKGKFDNFFLYPAMRLPHVDLSELYCYPAVNLREFFPGVGMLTLWNWTYESGRGAKLGGSFWFTPSVIGTYVTDDVSVSPEFALGAFNKAIDYEQKRFGRLGISEMEVPEETGIDSDAQAAIVRRYSSLVSLSRQGKASTK